MGPVVTSQEPSRTFYNYNKQKHQLVLRRTSLCFLFLFSLHVFTTYFVSVIEMHQKQTITYMGPIVNSQCEVHMSHQATF